jgi:hypothetical protein
MITGEFVLGDKSSFVERIRLFLEFQRFLDTPCLAGPSLHVPSNETPPIFKDFLAVLTGGLPCITADNSNGLKLLVLESQFTALPDSPGISRAPSFQSSRRVIQSDRNADAFSKSIAPLPDVDVVLSVPHGSYRDLVPHLQPMFQYLSRPKIAQGMVGFRPEKTQITRRNLQG